MVTGSGDLFGGGVVRISPNLKKQRAGLHTITAEVGTVSLPVSSARPEGATSSQPRASDRRERHPGLGQQHQRGAPGGGKSRGRSSSVVAFAPSGGVSETLRPNPGCRSLRSLALGCGLATPSGFCLNPCFHWTDTKPIRTNRPNNSAD